MFFLAAIGRAPTPWRRDVRFGAPPPLRLRNRRLDAVQNASAEDVKFCPQFVLSFSLQTPSSVPGKSGADARNSLRIEHG